MYLRGYLRTYLYTYTYCTVCVLNLFSFPPIITVCRTEVAKIEIGFEKKPKPKPWSHRRITEYRRIIEASQKPLTLAKLVSKIALTLVKLISKIAMIFVKLISKIAKLFGIFEGIKRCFKVSWLLRQRGSRRFVGSLGSGSHAPDTPPKSRDFRKVSWYLKSCREVFERSWRLWKILRRYNTPRKFRHSYPYE